MKSSWLTALGIISLIAVIIIGPILREVDYDFLVLFTVFGIILSLILIGIGEILAHLTKKDKKDNGKNENIRYD